jgi:hypothetical protein
MTCATCATEHTRVYAATGHRASTCGRCHHLWTHHDDACPAGPCPGYDACPTRHWARHHLRRYTGRAARAASDDEEEAPTVDEAEFAGSRPARVAKRTAAEAIAALPPAPPPPAKRARAAAPAVPAAHPFLQQLLAPPPPPYEELRAALAQVYLRDRTAYNHADAIIKALSNASSDVRGAAAVFDM